MTDSPDIDKLVETGAEIASEWYAPLKRRAEAAEADRARLARRVAELEAALREIVDRHMRPCGVHEVPLPCDVALAETYAIAAEALDVQEGGV